MRPHSKQFTPHPLIALLCLIAMITLAACSNAGTPQVNKANMAPANEQVFTNPTIVPDLKTFDPGQATDLASIAAVDLVFTGLVTENDQLQVVDQLAASHHVSSDGLTWTFDLRKNLHFSDGTSLTSQDVIYSIDRALSPQISNLNGISLTYLGLIQGAADRTTGKVASLIGTGLQAPDANTVVIHATQPSAYFLQALTYPCSYVVEKKIIDQWA